jgi:hypothetical protein
MTVVKNEAKNFWENLTARPIRSMVGGSNDVLDLAYVDKRAVPAGM